jgi:hypothetical protein
MLSSLPYAIAIVLVGVLAWDAYKRWLVYWQEELRVVHEFDALKRKHDEEMLEMHSAWAKLEVATKRSIEEITLKFQSHAVKVDNALSVENYKREMSNQRRIG